MVVFIATLQAFGIELQKSVTCEEALRVHVVMTLAVFSYLQPATRWTVRLDPGPGQPLGSAINNHDRALYTHGIEGAIHCVPGHSCIPRNIEVDSHTIMAPVDPGYTVCNSIYTSASNRARRISEGRAVVNAECGADKCVKNYGYRHKGKAGSK
jgi:hypothetical protein